MNNLKKGISVLSCLLLVAGMLGNAGLQMIKADTNGMGAQNGAEGNVANSDNSFAEEGTTAMGTVSQMPEFALNRALMYVEEVYVAAGDVVTEGDALFKIADESMEDAKAYYEKAVTMAQDTLKEAQAAYESGRLDAEYVKLDAETNAGNASAVLENALAELDSDIEEKYEKWQETAYLIGAYHDNFYNNIYYTNSGILEADKAVNEAQTAFDAANAAYAEAGTTYEEAKQGFESALAELETVSSGTGESTTTIEAAANAVVERYSILTTIEPLYQAVESTTAKLQQAKQNLEQKNSNYEKNVEQAEKSLEQLEASVDALEESYEAASREAEEKRLNLQKEYDTAVLEGKYAETTYNETIEKLKASVMSAEKSLADLKEEQAALLALENGVVCAAQSGTLASVVYEAEDVLFSGSAFVTYYETEKLTISVEIEQENIAKVAVGDTVSVIVSGNRRGNITGTVASVASAATTGRSVSDVTYAVVIAIENENNMLSAGTSATVTFTYGE